MSACFVVFSSITFNKMLNEPCHSSFLLSFWFFCSYLYDDNTAIGYLFCDFASFSISLLLFQSSFKLLLKG